MAPKGGGARRESPLPVNGVLVTEYVNVREVYVKVFITGVFNLDGRDVISRIT